MALDPGKRRLFHAEQLLREAPSRVRDRFGLGAPLRKRSRLATGVASSGPDKPLHIEEFHKTWQDLINDSEEASVEDLEKLLIGMAYVDLLEGTVHPLNTTQLPQAPRERLKRLFELQPYWKPELLAPLMQPVLHGVKVDVWLTRWARIVFIQLEEGKELRVFSKKFAGVD